MKFAITIAIVIAMSFSLLAQNGSTGVWDTGDENTKIEFLQKEEGSIYGKILSSDAPKAKTGKILVKDVKFKNGGWTGKIYSAKKEKWYDASFARKQDKLEVSISSGFFSKTLEWKRANS